MWWQMEYIHYANVIKSHMLKASGFSISFESKVILESLVKMSAQYNAAVKKPNVMPLYNKKVMENTEDGII